MSASRRAPDAPPLARRARNAATSAGTSSAAIIGQPMQVATMSGITAGGAGTSTAAVTRPAQITTVKATKTQVRSAWPRVRIGRNIIGEGFPDRRTSTGDGRSTRRHDANGGDRLDRAHRQPPASRRLVAPRSRLVVDGRALRGGIAVLRPGGDRVAMGVGATPGHRRHLLRRIDLLPLGPLP